MIVEIENLENVIKADDIFDAFINQILEQYLSKYNIVKGKRNRKLLLEKKGVVAFLMPSKLKFPLMTFDDDKPNPNLVYATIIRLIRMQKKEVEDSHIYKELCQYCYDILGISEYEPIYIQLEDGERIDLLTLISIM